MTKKIFKRGLPVRNLTQMGFTLIELLVVIAIIGILAAVVLASLNSARDKGEDAAAKSALNNSRAQAELYYDDNGRDYTDVCTTAGTDNGIQDLYQNAQDAVGATDPDCGDGADEWAAEVDLNETGMFYCVDSTGNATTTSGSTIDSGGSPADLTCGP